MKLIINGLPGTISSIGTGNIKNVSRLRIPKCRRCNVFVKTVSSLRTVYLTLSMIL